MGFNVLHEETIFPVRSLNIPINLKNTNDPTHPGTLIKNDCTDEEELVTGIAGKKDFISFDITKNHMDNEIGFLRKALSIFEKYNVSIDHIPSGIDSFSVICSRNNVGKYKYEIISDLKNELQADVVVDEDLALVAIVGRNMHNKSGVCGNIFSTLGSLGINVKIIAQGPSELSIIIGVETTDYDKALKALYAKLIG